MALLQAMTPRRHVLGVSLSVWSSQTHAAAAAAAVVVVSMNRHDAPVRPQYHCYNTKYTVP